MGRLGTRVVRCQECEYTVLTNWRNDDRRFIQNFYMWRLTNKENMIWRLYFRCEDPTVNFEWIYSQNNKYSLQLHICQSNEINSYANFISLVGAPLVTVWYKKVVTAIVLPYLKAGQLCWYFHNTNLSRMMLIFNNIMILRWPLLWEHKF